ncbi:PTS sugar transporter subunit IIA [Psychrobacillus sp. INOP01]|uniref:PTS sugar transporter subunit IIA n=1 Tax=Psychrobacillus sp. INOP01 TaxID=2829187 RepID=UPI001BA5484B|nr:PTS sugar transporter subunit IIA [Psychrobacillus sp. INOP01]QUG40637.1 PTS sugar transporter subunit IIA [Psychrobacillus sp. INOP01]
MFKLKQAYNTKSNKGEKILNRRILEKQAILPNATAKDWEDAVRLCGEILVKTGKVEATYVDAMIRNIQELGPYILIAPGVAMPHARPEDGVIQEGISVVVLKEEVAFEPGKEFKVLIGLAALNNESHIDILQKIAEVISKADSIEQLKNAKEHDEIFQLFM